ncbi:MerR family transcriptional regulator [Salinicoccus hispanicus]|uniref:MerR family transcriptional regulator n=2 Tax=Salinicoccus hispanicus TaxID=157225 RepID=A0A6N8U5G7_9STAP|nr:MerR family transcriptional regulator [Salinicoccus hispanicus]
MLDRDQMRRNLPIFPMSSAMKLTGLTARQIRYYESLSLVTPERTPGNHRIFSMNDLDLLLTIQDYMEKGFTMKRIGEILNEPKKVDTPEVLKHSEYRKPLINRGDLSRFFQ